MKVTKRQLKQIIKEELEAALDEKFTAPPEAKDLSRKRGMAPGLDLKRECARLLDLEAWHDEQTQDAASFAQAQGLSPEILDGSLRKKCEAAGHAEPRGSTLEEDLYTKE